MVFEYILTLLAGFAFGFFVGRRRDRLADRPIGLHEPAGETVAGEADAPQKGPSAAIRLQRLTTALDAAGEASSHPRDLAENAVFREAVAILGSPGTPLTVVTDYATGANWALGTAALVALCTRADRADAAGPVHTRFRHLRPWAMFHALRYLETLDAPPAVGGLMLHAEEWWADHPLLPSFFAEHFTVRAERGETPVFGDAIRHAGTAQLAATESLLKKIDHPTARALLAALTAHRASVLDREYLQTFGRFVEGDAERSLLVEHPAVKEQLAHAEASILQSPPRSLLVVGEPRSGKTSFLSLVAARAAAAGWTLFEAGGAQLQAGQMYIGQLEERLARLPKDLAVEKRVLWHVPDFLQLASSGTWKGQSASLLDQVMPAISAGRIIVVSEITPDGLTKLLQQRPAVRTAVEIIRLRALTDGETARLLDDTAARVTAQHAIAIPPGVLEASSYLARHYLGTGHMPGAVLDLLKLAVQRALAHDSRAVDREDVLATMTQLTGMPQQVLDDRERVDLAALRAFFSSRVIGQDEAVSAVVDRIAMLKAGLTDAGKPVAVFLFAGPTGTGKTELAKTLAEYLFGSPDRLIRLDMSEFQAMESIRKIVGEPDAAAESQALTDRVRKAPFSVVLLDEFEKANAGVWDLFLQVFDDGRLTDARGQTVDFRHCLIILTSNVGSTIREDGGAGFLAHSAALSAQHVMRAIGRSFRPEFLNRLDRIIVFRPLGREQMRGIVAKELSLVLERRGLRHREWAVEWEASALEFLLDKGFSPAMGARPLKRAIDQHLLAPLAATLVEHRFPEGDQFLFVRSDGRALQVEFVDPDADSEAAPPADMEPVAPTGLTLARMIVQPTGAASERMALIAERHQLESRLTDERWTMLESELASRMQHADFWNAPDRQRVLSRFEVMDRVTASLRTARSLAGRLDRSASVSGRYSKDLVSRLASQLLALGHGIDDVLADAPVEVVLAVQPVADRTTHAETGMRWCERVLEMYRNWAGRRGMQLSDVEGGGAIVTLLVISGFGAARLLAREEGLHVLDYEDGEEAGRTIARVTVRATPAVLPELPGERYALLLRELEKGAPPSTVVRRYRIDASPVIRDVRRGWRTGRASLVFDGHFDLMGEISPKGTEEVQG